MSYVAEMSMRALVDLLDLFESNDIEVWLDGGWAVDVHSMRIDENGDGIYRMENKCAIWYSGGPVYTFHGRRTHLVRSPP